MRTKPSLTGRQIWQNYAKDLNTKVNAHIMPISGRVSLVSTLSATFLFVFSDLTFAQQSDFPGDFRLGGSLEEAQHHAAARGWKLDQLSSQFPWAWVVEGQDITLHFCNGFLRSITQDTSGSLDEFAQLVFEFEIARGKPEVKVGTFVSGGIRFADISARFPDLDGVGVGLRLDSIAGRHSIKTNYFTETGPCN